MLPFWYWQVSLPAAETAGQDQSRGPIISETVDVCRTEPARGLQISRIACSCCPSWGWPDCGPAPCSGIVTKPSCGTQLTNGLHFARSDACDRIIPMEACQP